MKSIYPFFLVTFLIFGLLELCGQTENFRPEPTTFIKYFGEAGISRGVTVEETVDGGYILTGYSTNGNYGGEDVFLTKTNSEGEPTWTKYFGGQEQDNGWAVRQTVDGGYIIVGFTNSFGNGDMDIYVLKTDSNGETTWAKTFGGEGDEYGWDIRITEDKGFIIAAQTSSLGNGEIDAYLIKLDAMGNEEWSRTYGADKVDRIFSVRQTFDTGYVAAGITYSYTSIGPVDRDGYLLKTDADGHQEWYRTIGKDAYDVAHDIALTNDGGYITTGYGESYAENGGRDVYLIKSDGAGNQQWIQNYGGIEDERGIKGQQTKDGGYIAIGFTDKNFDLYLLKTDGIGQTMWTRTFGEKDKVEFGYTVEETRDGGYILIGHSQNPDGTESQVLLIKTDSLGLVHQKN